MSEICCIATLHPSLPPLAVRSSLTDQHHQSQCNRTIFVLPIFIRLCSSLPVFRRFTLSLTGDNRQNFHQFPYAQVLRWLGRKKDLNYAHGNKLRNIFITCVCIRVVCLSFASRPGRFSAGQLFFVALLVTMNHGMMNRESSTTTVHTSLLHWPRKVVGIEVNGV